MYPFEEINEEVVLCHSHTCHVSRGNPPTSTNARKRMRTISAFIGYRRMHPISMTCHLTVDIEYCQGNNKNLRWLKSASEVFGFEAVIGEVFGF